MSEFNIEEHILDHLYKIIDNLNHYNGKPIHFNTSADIAYFIRAGFVTQDTVNEVMVNIINNVSEKVIYASEKNTVYIDKKGNKKQKNRIRKIEFNSILLAYHDKHFDASKSVNPHFHILCNKKTRMGINFIYLKQALAEEASKYNVKFNFMEKRQKTGLSSVKLRNLKSMNWIFQKGDLNEIHNFITNKENALNRNIDSLVTHYEHTENLSFLLKTLLIINQRLDELNLDYMYSDINLKENIFFFLTSAHIERIKLLKEGSVIKINLDNVFDRELLKFSYEFETEVMDILVNKFDIKSIKKEQLEIEKNFMDNDVIEKDFIGFRDLVIMDIRNAMVRAKSEEEFKSIMYEMKYEKIALKTSKNKTGKRNKIGFNIITEKKMKMSIPFHQLQLSWSKIVMIFSHNRNKKKQKKKLMSNLGKYEKARKKNETELIKFEYKVPKLLRLNYKKDSNDIKIEKFGNYHIERSELYRITTLRNNNNTIVVTNNNSIALKKSSGDKTIVQDIMSLVKLMEWDMDYIVVSGDDKLVEKIKLITLVGISEDENERGMIERIRKI